MQALIFVLVVACLVSVATLAVYGGIVWPLRCTTQIHDYESADWDQVPGSPGIWQVVLLASLFCGVGIMAAAIFSYAVEPQLVRAARLRTGEE